MKSFVSIGETGHANRLGSVRKRELPLTLLSNLFAPDPEARPPTEVQFKVGRPAPIWQVKLHECSSLAGIRNQESGYAAKTGKLEAVPSERRTVQGLSGGVWPSVGKKAYW